MLWFKGSSSADDLWQEGGVSMFHVIQFGVFLLGNVFNIGIFLYVKVAKFLKLEKCSFRFTGWTVLTEWVAIRYTE